MLKSSTVWITTNWKIPKEDPLNSGRKGKMEQKRKALAEVSWEEVFFSQLSRRSLPLGPELHKYPLNGSYTETGNEM